MRRRVVSLAVGAVLLGGCCNPDVEVRVPDVAQSTADLVGLLGVVTLLTTAAALVGWVVRQSVDDDPFETGGVFGVAVAAVAGAACLGTAVLAVVAATVAGAPAEERLVQGAVTVVVENDADDVGELVGAAWATAVACAVATGVGFGLRRSHGRAADVGWSVLLFLAGVVAAYCSWLPKICPNAELRNDGLELIEGVGLTAGLLGVLLGFTGAVVGVVQGVRGR